MVMTLAGPRPSPDLSRAFLNTNGAAKHAAGVACPRRTPPRSGQSLGSSPARDGRQPEVRLPPRPRRAVRRHHRRAAPCSCPSAARPSAPRPRSWPPSSPWSRTQETDQASVMAWGCDPDALSSRPLPRGQGRGLRLRGQAGGRRRGLPEGLSDSFQEFFEKLRRRARPAGASPSPPCWGPWTPSWSWAPPPSAARTPCRAPSTIWMCPPR